MSEKYTGFSIKASGDLAGYAELEQAYVVANFGRRVYRNMRLMGAGALTTAMDTVRTKLLAARGKITDAAAKQAVQDSLKYIGYAQRMQKAGMPKRSDQALAKIMIELAPHTKHKARFKKSVSNASNRANG